MKNIYLILLCTLFTISCASIKKVTFLKCSEFPGLASISTKGKNPIQVYFDSNLKEKAETILEFAKKSDKELSKFYRIKRTNPYRIYLAKDRNQFEKLTSTKRDWKKTWFVVGTALTKNDAFILNPKVWDKRSHEYIKLNELVKHEMAHSFSISLNGKFEGETCFLNKVSQANSRPFWFEEGLATIASGQITTWKNRGHFNFKKYPKFEQILINYGNYTTAGSAVQFLIKKYGKEKILSIIPQFPADYYNKIELTNPIIFKTLGVNSSEKTQIEYEWKQYVQKYFPSKQHN